MRLGAFMRPVSIHTAAWRYPGAIPDANSISPTSSASPRRWSAASSMPSSWPTTWPCSNADERAQAQRHGDVVRSRDLAPGAGGGHRAPRADRHRFDHLRRALHVARRFASLDQLSGGRAGWNVVTTGNPEAAGNFGLEDHLEHASATACARVRRGGHGPVGQLGRRRVLPR